MKRVLLGLPGNEGLTHSLSSKLNAETGQLTLRSFPDGEAYVKIGTEVSACEVILVCTLHKPNEKLLPLIFIAETVKDLGAAKVGLIAPYLAYMRQDHQFHPGEGITSIYFGRLITTYFDWLITVDPHLHRFRSLSEVFYIPGKALHAAPIISAWIKSHVDHPLLIGPDSESAQWVASVAAQADAPYVVLEKIRRGDQEVEVSVPEIEKWRDRTPVLVDDIISTAQTMIETIKNLKRCAMKPPVCIGVHGVFAGNAYADLIEAGAGKVITSNTIPHQSNGIEVSHLIAQALLSK